jgi:hypothetical protein
MALRTMVRASSVMPTLADVMAQFFAHTKHADTSHCSLDNGYSIGADSVERGVQQVQENENHGVNKKKCKTKTEVQLQMQNTKAKCKGKDKN